jgi:hypothetical protein
MIKRLTNSSKFFVACLSIGWITVPSLAMAEMYFSDAFGLVETKNFEDSKRASWSGVQELIYQNKVVSQHYSEPKKSDTLLTFIGPKSAVAGKDDVHAVTIIQDRLGNMVADNTDVIYKLGLPKFVDTFTQSGIADVIFIPQPNAGTFHTGATTKNKQSARAEYRIVPDLDALDLIIEPVKKTPLPEAFSSVQSIPLKDKYENPIGDGVAFQLHLKHPDKSTTVATGVSVDDIARSRLLTRTLYNEANVFAWLGNIQSEPIPFFFQQIKLNVPPKITATALPSIDAVEFKLGPFLTEAGHMLNDGTPLSVSVTFSGQPKQVLNGWLKDGMFNAIFLGKREQLPAKIFVSAESGQFDLNLESFVTKETIPEWRIQ